MWENAELSICCYQTNVVAIHDRDLSQTQKICFLEDLFK